MGQRSDLHTILLALMPEDSKNVYHQRPPSVGMSYPCIVYTRDALDTIHADNAPYRHEKRYQVTIMDQNPDSAIPDAVANLPKCSFDRHFTADNLNHDVYNLYF